MAKSITGINIGSHAGPIIPDIEVTFNNESKWYTGIEGKTPPGESDLVTICLHELMHGLVFSGAAKDIFKYRYGAFLTTKTEDGEYCSLKTSYISEPRIVRSRNYSPPGHTTQVRQHSTWIKTHTRTGRIP